MVTIKISDDLRLTIKSENDDSSSHSCSSNKNNLGSILCWHKYYDLGEMHSFSRPKDLFKTYKRKQIIFLPVYLQDYPELKIQTEPFLSKKYSGQIGYIIALKKEIKKACGKKLDKKEVLKILDEEVTNYSHELIGTVYSFKLERKNKSNSWYEIESGVDMYGYADIFVNINCVLTVKEEETLKDLLL
jgi:hypothetical protein